jgi:hypothetical protein
MVDNMDGTSFLIYLFLGLLLLLVLGVSRLQAQERKSLLEYQAAKRHGEIIKGDWFNWPRLRLVVHSEEVDIFMTPQNRYRPAQTQIQFTPQRNALTDCELTENRFSQKIMISSGKERVLTQDKTFDTRYTLLTNNDLSVAARLTQPSVRERLLKYSFPNLVIKVSPDSFKMSMDRIPRNNEDFDHFIETAISIIQYL